MIDPWNIIEYIESSERKFESEQQRSDESGISYVTDRGFYERVAVSDRLLRASGLPAISSPSINETLPTFEGLSAAEILERMVYNASEQIRVADLGCGRGRALLDIENRYGDKVEVSGISAKLYSGSYLYNGEIRVGNINQLWKYLSDKYFDFIYSAFTILHTGQHIFDHAMRVYRHLRPGGIALLEGTGASEELRCVSGFSEIKNWLDQRGYQIEFDSIGNHDPNDITAVALRRTPNHSDLFLPVKHIFKPNGEFEGMVFDKDNSGEYDELVLGRSRYSQ